MVRREVEAAFNKIGEGLADLRAAIAGEDLAGTGRAQQLDSGSCPLPPQREDLTLPGFGNLLSGLALVRKWLPAAEQLLNDLKGIFGR